MLQAIRDRVTGILAWLIIGLISIPFALWGIDQYLQRDVKLYAAKVNDVEISVQDFRFAYLQQLNRLRNLLGERFDRATFSTPEFKKQVLERLVEEEVIVQAAGEAGMAISDALLASRIHAMQEFQEDGQFSEERYRLLLNRQNLTPARFEQLMRRSLLIDQYVGGIRDTAVATPAEVDQGLRLQGQQRHVRYVRIPASDFQDVEISEEDIQARYQELKDRFIEPEQVRLQYIELKLSDLTAGIEVDEDELKRLYEQRKQQAADEQRRARHILVEVGQNASEQEVAAAREKAEKLVKQLREGADFAELAKKESDDPGSAPQGGDLGFFGRGAMVPEFEEAAFALAKGAISDPVRSPFGFHIIQVTDIRKGKAPSFEEMRDQLIEEAYREQVEERFYDLADKLSNAAFEQPDSLEAAAEATGLKIQETGWVSQQGGGSGIAAEPKVLAAAFSNDVLEEGNNSEPIELGPDHVVVVRVAERKPARQRPLDEVRDQIVVQLRLEHARVGARQRGEALLGKLEGGETLDALAKAEGLDLQDAGFVARNDRRLDPQILAEVFRAPRLPEGRPSRRGLSLRNGDYIVFEVTEIRDGDPKAVGEEERKGFARNLARLHGTMQAQAAVEALKDKAVIELNLDAIQ